MALPSLMVWGGWWRMTVIKMSHKELARLQVLIDWAERRISVEEAMTLMALGRSQAFRLRRRFLAVGPHSLASKRRGQPSNHTHGPVLRSVALELVRERYADFGPTLAAEKLRELHDLPLGVETLRQWMMADGLWLRRRDRKRQVHQPRHRRDCLGELVQIDGCQHWWFEDRGPRCTLLVFIDDATGRLMQLRFVPSESAFAYFLATRGYIEQHGKPIAFYSDKHTVFRSNNKDPLSEGMTQYGRALHELNIDILCANVPEAKGRVERAHKTLQDRLVKELRLAGISDLDAANAFVGGYVEDFNRRFARQPRLDKDLHRSLRPQDDLESSFTWREDRKVSKSLTLQYARVLFILEPNEISRGLPGKLVTVTEFPDGRLELRHQGRPLPYRTFDYVRRVDQGAITDNKRLGEALELCRKMQAELPPLARRRPSPSRRIAPSQVF
jgi:hypothetical protein